MAEHLGCAEAGLGQPRCDPAFPSRGQKCGVAFQAQLVRDHFPGLCFVLNQWDAILKANSHHLSSHTSPLPEGNF